MKFQWHIFALMAGIAMALPKVVSWLRLLRARHARRKLYAPSTHSDFVVVVGRKGLDLDTILTCIAGVGVLLVILGAWGIWHA